MREWWVLTSWLPQAFCGELMMNYVVQVGAYFANQMCALCCTLKFVSSWCVETNFELWVGGMNECFRSIELRSFDLIGGNTQLDFE